MAVTQMTILMVGAVFLGSMEPVQGKGKPWQAFEPPGVPAGASTNQSKLGYNQEASYNVAGLDNRPIARMAIEYTSPPTVIPGTYAFVNGAPTCRDRPYEYASVSPDCTANLLDFWPVQDSSGRQIFNVQQPQPGENAYTITVGSGRAGCNRNTWSYQGCGGSTEPDLFFGNDGSGRQLFAFEPVPGPSPPRQYYIVALQRYLPTPQSCAAYLSTGPHNCTFGDRSLRFVNRDNGSYEGFGDRWTLLSVSPPNGFDTAIGAPPLTPGTYNLVNQGACFPAASVLAPEYLAQRFDGLISSNLDTSGRQVFRVSLVPGTTNRFTITTTSGRTNIVATFIGHQDCATTSFAGNIANVAYDGFSVLQQWAIVPAPYSPELGLYYLIGSGRSNCDNYLTLPECGDSNPYAAFASGLPEAAITYRKLWKFVPANVPSPLLLDGTYHISLTSRIHYARPSCKRSLIGNSCQLGPSLGNDPPEDDQYRTGVWTVKLVEGTDIYTISTYYPCYANVGVRGNETPRAGYLSGYSSDDPDSNAVAFSRFDDGSGLQRWRITPAELVGSSIFNIQSVGRGTSASFLSVQECGGSNVPDLFIADDQSGRQQWTFFPYPV